MNSPFAYLGGKSRLAKRIIARIPEDHVCYCEPFCGAAWVLFQKDPSKAEVINDADSELVTFWRVIQNHLEPFIEYYKWAVVSREIFEIEKMKRPETLTDIQRAVRYFYLQRLCFGGKPKGRVYGMKTLGSPALNLSSIAETLLAVHWRLEKVNIEHLDAFDCLTRYDRPHTLFFIDPPYFHSTDDYAVSFDRFQALADLLAGIKGRFLLSLGNCKEVRSIFRPFQQTEVKLGYSVGSSEASRKVQRSELIIQNF